MKVPFLKVKITLWNELAITAWITDSCWKVFNLWLCRHDMARSHLGRYLTSRWASAAGYCMIKRIFSKPFHLPHQKHTHARRHTQIPRTSALLSLWALSHTPPILILLPPPASTLMCQPIASSACMLPSVLSAEFMAVINGICYPLLPV